MKKILFIILVSAGLGVSCSTKAATPVIASDTTGEHSMIRSISADMCRQLEEENKKTPLASLSREAATQLFARVMMVSAANNPMFMKAVVANKDNAKAYGEQMGRKVATWMVRECPISQPLFMKVGAQHLRQQNTMSAQEIKLLTPIAAAACQGVEARQKKQDFAAMSAQQRVQVIGEIMQDAMKPHAKALSEFYGADIFLDNKRLEQIGVKVAIQMADQCPATLGIASGVGQGVQGQK